MVICGLMGKVREMWDLGFGNFFFLEFLYQVMVHLRGFQSFKVKGKQWKQYQLTLLRNDYKIREEEFHNSVCPGSMENGS